MVAAFVLISVDTGGEKSVLQKLRQIPEVVLSNELYGEWDIIAKIEVKDIRDLDGIVSLKIRKVPGVKLTSTMVVAA
jgi:DNA-binding Lrp family transcriptional regulator